MTDGDETADTAALTRAVVDDSAEAYGREEPFDMVEREHIETLPPAFASGEFGRRDAEWVVQWYYRRRRRIGAITDAERRDGEERFLKNDYDAVVESIQGAASATDLVEQCGRLTDLAGVDVAVASAFLAFIRPARHVAVGAREWDTLHAAGELSAPSPDPVTTAAYGRYLDAVGAVADRVDRDRWTVYRALWQQGDDGPN
ncbi:hypothetical protein [Haloplanus sp.]|uniref:hypothetical protein n=1 Tax=Haloplanus sp. TaxID=1961696 RepID=UPI00262436E9|nr:hypothetical protein [Haloplanus sp.]